LEVSKVKELCLCNPIMGQLNLFNSFKSSSFAEQKLVIEIVYLPNLTP